MSNQPSTAELVARNALFVANHSGGKDSQATLIFLLRQGIPARQIVVVHATLGDLEWPGALELAQAQAQAAGVAFRVAHAFFKDGSAKTLLNKAEHQYRRRPEVPSWPAGEQRWCTSELKTGPCEREVRRYAAEHGFKLIVNCLGIRAAESTERSKKQAWEFKSKLSVAGRTWFNWLPIFTWQTLDVWCAIRGAGQWPHEAYNGNERLSCLFCIYGSKSDLQHAAREFPDVLARYVALEERTGWTMHISRLSLTELVAEAEVALAA